jgi:hypothetical protein
MRNDLFLLSATLLGLAATISKREEIAAASANVIETATDLYQNVETFMSNLTRGERNKNPGNIVKSNLNWVGKVSGNDTKFETFNDPIFGIRAISRLLASYHKRGLNTIRAMISTYAPSTENATENYINFVSNKTGIPADQILVLDNDTLVKLTSAIIEFENGRIAYSPELINDAVSMA